MTGFAVKLDENLGRTHLELVRERGYEAARVFDQGLSGEADDRLWTYLVEEARFFVTLDLDFSDVRRFEPGSHPGILLLRPRNKGRGAVLSVLRRVLDEAALESYRGCLVVADELNTRVRRPRAE